MLWIEYGRVLSVVDALGAIGDVTSLLLPTGLALRDRCTF